MKIITILILIILSSRINTYSQKVSDYIKCSTELGSIEIDGKTSLQEIKKIGTFRKKIIQKKNDNHYYKSRYFDFGDTIHISQHKGSIWEFKFHTSEIGLNYPIRIITNKGIQIGTSTLEDVIETYGKPAEKSFNYIIYKLPNDIWLWFYFYDSEETDADYNPNLKDKVISITIN